MRPIPPLPHVTSLAELPWFELRAGRLALREPLGPIIDVHTHLALGYGLPTRFDLCGDHGPMEHYLPLHRALDLDVYVNRNFTKDDRDRLGHDLTFASLTAGGMRRTHTVPNLAREMDEMGVALSLLLPIDYPVLSWNADRYLDAAARRPEVVSLASVHPYAIDVAGKLRRQRDRGARGLKFHPAVQLVPPDHDRAIRLFHLCGELGLPVLFHCGPAGIEPKLGQRLSQVRRYRRAAVECPETTFVLGHSGAMQFEEALALACEYENVCLEVSCQAVSHVRRVVEEAPPDRIMFGSDWPFYHQAIPLAKVLLATEDRKEVLPRLLWENAARVFGLEAQLARRSTSSTSPATGSSSPSADASR